MKKCWSFCIKQVLTSSTTPRTRYRRRYLNPAGVDAQRISSNILRIKPGNNKQKVARARLFAIISYTHFFNAPLLRLHPDRTLDCHRHHSHPLRCSPPYLESGGIIETEQGFKPSL